MKMLKMIHYTSSVMKYINNRFLVEKVNLNKLAKKFETPLYCYSYEKLKHNINNFKLNFKSFSPLICFEIGRAHV